MSKVYEFPRLERRYDEASAWIAKLDSGLSAQDEIALQKWIAADDENRAVLLKMASLWDRMGELSRLSDLFPKRAGKFSKSLHYGLASAAAIILAVTAAVWVASTVSSNPAENVVHETALEQPYDAIYETAVGEQSTVRLPDGTNVVLNTNSRIGVEYTDHYRLLNLDRGEIHVQVAHDRDRPLSVIAGDKVVKALGTAFSIEMTSDRRIELVVTEGKVLVGVQESSDYGRSGAAPNILESASVTVTAGEQFMLDDPDEHVLEVSPEDIEVKLSWRQGNLIFRGESLEDAVAEIERYTTVEFVILDDALKKVRIAGLFKAGDVDGLLATLTENFDVAFERTSDGRILLTSL